MTPPSNPLRVGCMISGGGRTVLNLEEAIARGEVPARIEVVVAHREDIAGVRRCRDAGLRVEVVPTSDGRSRDELAAGIDAVLESAGVELVCLAGYLRHFRVDDRWTDRVINIHPSLLPRHGGRGMYGDRVHAAVLEAGDRESGCTVHLVDEIYDHGGVILQRRCPVRRDDSIETLAVRVFEQECLALPQAVTGIARGDVRLQDGRVLGSLRTEC